MDDGVRTRDLHLGKVPRYQLRHIHISARRCLADPLSVWGKSDGSASGLAQHVVTDNRGAFTGNRTQAFDIPRRCSATEL